MNRFRRPIARVEAWLLRLLCLLTLTCGAIAPANACTSGGCVSAGPRLASVNSVNGALLNALLGNLTGSTLALNVGDWNALATGDVSLAKTVSALQASLGVSSPSTALSTSATLAQVIGAAATAATNENQTSVAAALNALKVPLSLVGGSIKLGDLLVSDGILGNTRLNALELATGALQLYNARNVLTTPSPIVVSGTNLGIPGLASQVSISAQVVEPPVFVCGPVGSTFHTATVRLKLGIELLTLNLDATLLKAIPLVSTASAQVAHLDLYVEVAHADGVISSLNAVANAFTVQATPGVASLYLGLMSDSVFFNRSHPINVATDLGWSTIGSVTIGAVSVAILAKAAATGTAVSASNLSFTGPYPQSYTISAGGAFATTLISSLVGNLQLSLGSGLGTTLTAAVSAVLQPLVQVLLPTVLQPLVDGLINPLLELLGVGLGEAIVNSGGTVLACSVSGTVYEDANHSAKLEYGETGSGATLYAKLVPSAQPTGPATAVATVDPTTGAYSFTGITAQASYLVVINGSSAAAQVTPAAPGGWVATETPSLSLATTLATTDLAGQRFGLYHGSKLAGTVFKDNGIGSGTANNGLVDGTEKGVVGMTVKLVNAAGTTTYDTTTSGDSGGYTVWAPFAAGNIAMKVVQTLGAHWIAVSGAAGTTAGSYAQATATVSFTQASGSNYTGVNFGVVPANRFEPDGQQQVIPGQVAFFTHSFTAGSAGQVTVSAAGTGAAGWSTVLYADANCNGKIDGADAVTTTMSVVADQKVCVVAKVATPASVQYGAQYSVALTAHFAYANNTLASDHLRGDLVTVGNTTDSGLRLVKSVDKATAATGDTITYTVTYVNQSDAAITALKVQDATPAYTVFASTACGAVPNAQISCAVSQAPAVGASGRIEWSFTGSLSAGGTGTVTFRVLLQ